MSLGAPQGTDSPEFTISMRGYDRVQVDEFIGQMADLLAEAQARAEQAEARLTAVEQEARTLRERLGAGGSSPAGGATAVAESANVGEAVAQVRAIIDRAVQEGTELRRRLQEKGEAAVEMARANAVDIVCAAQAAVAGLEDAANADRAAAAEALQRATAEADSAGQRRLAEAEQRAGLLVAAAEERAAGIIRQAESELERRRAQLQADIDDLVARRRHAMAELGRLGQSLGLLAAGRDGQPDEVEDTEVIMLDENRR